jgi:hypothetical protein
MAVVFSRLEFGIVARARGEGRSGSAVAAAAYNLCGRLDHAGRSFDFTRKRNEYVGGGVLLPVGAAPELSDQGFLWRAAEAAECRVDAQVARQVLLSVPRDVRPEDRSAFAEAIAAAWVADGMVVQYDVHNPVAVDGGEQPHIHFLLSLRRATPDGFAPKKAREWNVAFREASGRAERQRVAERANAWLAMQGYDARLDLRSLTDQGVDRPPEPSAPRADWQRWRREGGDADRAPETVAAVLDHRRRRSALDDAVKRAADATHEAALLTARLSALSPPRTLSATENSANPSNPGRQEGAYTPETKPSATEIPPAQNATARNTKRLEGAQATSRPDHYAVCRAAWQQEQRGAAPMEPRAALRARHTKERDLLYGKYRSGPARKAKLEALVRRQAAERIEARACLLTVQLSGASRREAFETWVMRAAAAKHPAATALVEARTRAAAARARHDPAGEAMRRLAAWQQEARDLLDSAPPDKATISMRATAVSKRAMDKENMARSALAAARQAVRNHARRVGWLRGLFIVGRAAATEHRRLIAAVEVANRRLAYAIKDTTEEARALAHAAAKSKKSAKEARAAWARGPGALAVDRLTNLNMISAAVQQNHGPTIAAILTGDQLASAQAARTANPNTAGGNGKVRLRPAGATKIDARATALVSAYSAELAAKNNPATLARARIVTAAALAGHPAVIGAADAAGAERAALEWHTRGLEAAAAATAGPQRRQDPHLTSGPTFR